MSLSLCLSVCEQFSVLWNYMSDLRQILCVCVCVTYGRGSVLLWQRCDMLCTSGFIDDVIFRTYFGLCDVDRYFCNE